MKTSEASAAAIFVAFGGSCLVAALSVGVVGRLLTRFTKA